MTTRILRKPEVLAKTGLGNTTLYDRIKSGDFPRPIPISARMRGWVEYEVDQWIARRVAERVGPS